MPSDQWVVLIHSPCLEGSEREMWAILLCDFWEKAATLFTSQFFVIYFLFTDPSLHFRSHPAYFLYSPEGRQSGSHLVAGNQTQRSRMT